MKILHLVFLLFFIVHANIHASEATVYSTSVKGDFDQTYKNVYQALEKNRLFVVFEPDIGSNLSTFAKRWGKDYNRNKLDRVKSMVFCNAWYANQVSNKAVEMMAMCPLHITLTHHAGMTSIHFVRPDAIAKGSKAESIARELTELVIKSIQEGIQSVQKIR
jgi:uncharacterized protein (DUF302 family)